VNCQYPEKKAHSSFSLTATLGLAIILFYIPWKPARKVTVYMAGLIEVDHKDIILSSFMLFVQTAQSVLKYADAYLYWKMRLSVSKLIVLKALDINREGMRPSKLADWTNTERHNITTLIKRMKQDGLVTTERNSSDKRLVNIKLTDKGREVLGQVIPVAQEIVDQVMLSINEGDTVLLKAKLRTMRQNAHDGLEHLAKH
jgi:DNA-binding MarR family transcriptional regulator